MGAIGSASCGTAGKRKRGCRLSGVSSGTCEAERSDAEMILLPTDCIFDVHAHKACGSFVIVHFAL